MRIVIPEVEVVCNAIGDYFLGKAIQLFAKEEEPYVVWTIGNHAFVQQLMKKAGKPISSNVRVSLIDPLTLLDDRLRREVSAFLTYQLSWNKVSVTNTAICQIVAQTSSLISEPSIDDVGAWMTLPVLDVLMRTRNLRKSMTLQFPIAVDWAEQHKGITRYLNSIGFRTEQPSRVSELNFWVVKAEFIN